MTIKNYIKSKFIYVLMYAFFLIFIFLFFLMFNLSIVYFTFFSIGSVFTFLFFLIINYIYLYKNFSSMIKQIKVMEEGYFITYMYDKPNDFESVIIYDIIKEANDILYRKYKDEIDKQTSYQDYINMWIHEVKLPIQNIKNLTYDLDNDELSLEIDYLNLLIEKILSLSKISFEEINFLVTKVNIATLVNDVVKKRFNSIMENDINISNEINTDLENGTIVNLYLDSYWFKFVLTQILDNSIKYKATSIRIRGEILENEYHLFIEDNGIGIYEDEISYIYKKFYTGSHSKQYVSSSGLGLYMAKKLLDQMDIKIKIRSKVNKYTKVELIIRMKKDSIKIDDEKKYEFLLDKGI